MSKIAIIFTGGTIAMQESSADGLARPALKGRELLEAINLGDSEVEIIDFGNFPSPHLEFKDMLEIYNKLESIIKDKDISGVVITHGTDTLEETAFFIDCIYSGAKPVVFTGAMRNQSQLGYDGYTNLADAIVVAKENNSRGYGVMVVMAGEIHAARDVTKSHTSSLTTFKSPDKGLLGVVDCSKVVFYRTIKRFSTVKPKKVNAKISLIKAVASMGDDFVQSSIRNNYQGIIVEAMGRGNVPPLLAKKLKEAIRLNLIVVVCSRCQKGRVAADYGYEGSANDLAEAGAILAGDMSGLKARIRLTVALSAGLDRNIIKTMFNNLNK